MEYNLQIGGIGFYIVSYFPIRTGESFAPFSDSRLTKFDIHIAYTEDFSQAPSLPCEALGEDLLLRYYAEGSNLLIVAKGGPRGPIAITRMTQDCSDLVCYVNAAAYGTQDALSDLMRMLPLCRILQMHDVFFFHAAQIAVNGTGILFTAPSGTGKTTQAKLWRQHRGAEIICNDRTLVRKGRTYGFPVDGSEPVRSGLVHSLGALVLLKQNSENSVRRLRPGAALARLMPQLVIDTWDPAARTLAIEQLMELMKHYPVYQLECTPDLRAVACLEAQLRADGVIE